MVELESSGRMLGIHRHLANRINGVFRREICKNNFEQPHRLRQIPKRSQSSTLDFDIGYAGMRQSVGNYLGASDTAAGGLRRHARRNVYGSTEVAIVAE